MRAAVREILARRMPEAPAEYVALQLGRLNEALLVAYSAMSGANIRAVECVVRIVREMDRYHGFAAAGRRVARNGRAMEAEAATDGSPPALQATEESRQRAPINALTAAASPISAPPGQGEAPAAPLGERPAAVSQRVEGTEVSPGPSVAALTDGSGADLYEAETRPCERPLDQAQGETTHENVGSAPVPGPLVCEPVPAAGRVDGADALQSDRPHLAPEVSERTENAPGESLSLEATGPDVNPVWTRQREPGEAIPQSVEEPVIGGLLPSPAFPAAASNGGAAARPQMAPQDPESIECAPENDMRAGLPDDRNAVAAPGHAPGGEAPPQDAPGPEVGPPQSESARTVRDRACHHRQGPLGDPGPVPGGQDADDAERDHGVRLSREADLGWTTESQPRPAVPEREEIALAADGAACAAVFRDDRADFRLDDALGQRSFAFRESSRRRTARSIRAGRTRRRCFASAF